MDYILLGATIVGITIISLTNYFISRYFAKKNYSNQIKVLETYRKELFQFSITQKQNTEKLIELLNRLFVNTDTQTKPEPNEATKANEDEIDFSEQNPINLPNDVKFEIEGGDSFIPPGYSQKAGEA